MKFQIRKDGMTYAAWNDTKFNYDAKTLKSMIKAGYHLYENGKRVK